MANVIFKVGTRAQYDLIQEKDPNTLYWLTDEQALYKGDKLFGTGMAATQTTDGLFSAVDKKKLDDLSKGEIVSLTSDDGSIEISELEHGRDLKVKISDADGNQIKLNADENPGLFVGNTEFELEKEEEGAEDYAAVYRLKVTKDGNVSYAEGKINIPKDVFFKTCDLKVVETPDVPYSGAAVGDPYLDVTLTNDTHSYIPMKGLVDTSNFVQKSIKSGNGEALITNDQTGGGAWYTRNDGLQGYVGVNDGEESGGKPTPMAQIYTAKKEDDGSIKDGSFLSAYQDKITYVSQTRAKNGGKLSDPKGELAIVGDIDDAKEEARALYSTNHYEVINLLDGCRVDMNGKEIRVMFPENAPFVKPSGDAEGRDPDCYYFGFKVYAPSDDITGFKESDKETVPPETPLEDFSGSSSGVDKYGRKFDVCWFPAAKCTGEDDWKYYGDDSVAGMYVGWYHTIEWYNKDNVCVGSETVRINLTNKDCHNSLKQYLGKDNTINIAWEEM